MEQNSETSRSTVYNLADQHCLANGAVAYNTDLKTNLFNAKLYDPSSLDNGKKLVHHNGLERGEGSCFPDW